MRQDDTRSRPERRHISIHAPTRGATNWFIVINNYHRDFNPRTHTGCDQNHRLLSPVRIYNFNPRTHTGCDGSANGSLSWPIAAFQSTHPHGVRPVRPCFHPASSLFQSTHPHGVRRAVPPGLPHCRNDFNPRTHTGCDTCQFQNK